MGVKYVFVTGGVVSGLGKGITAASLGRLLKERGFKVTMQKLDTYINIDPSTINPIHYGEVFVTEDGAETDLDLGHYERFTDEDLTKQSNVSIGKIYWNVLNKERKGEYENRTVQIVPHITDEIKSYFYGFKNTKEDQILIIEVGGTVGDMENQPFLEGIRQFQNEVGHENAILIHVTLIPYLPSSGEMKTKPTQASLKDLQAMGLRPDIIVCRTQHPLTSEIREKLSLICNVPNNHIIQNIDVDNLYEVPLTLEKEHFAEILCKCLNINCSTPDLSEWTTMVESLKYPQKKVTIALVGKYTKRYDAYLSVVESLKHGGIPHHCLVDIKCILADDVTDENVGELLSNISGVLVPGGFGDRGVNGKMSAIRYARENNVPFLGICLGMQLATIEYARNIIGFTDAHSIELDPYTTHPVIHLMRDQEDVEDTDGVIKLGSYPIVLQEHSKVYELYGKKIINERHRHRYVVNNIYRKDLTEGGLKLSGLSPDGKIVEIIELENHPWFIATQAHPEFKSRPNKPHPLFLGFVGAALKYQDEHR